MKKPKLQKVIEVSETKDDMGKDEWWCTWFRCNNCEKSDITSSFKYCPHCGLKIKWTK